MDRSAPRTATSLDRIFIAAFWIALTVATLACDPSTGLIGSLVPPDRAFPESYAMIGERMLAVPASNGVLANDTGATSVTPISGNAAFGGSVDLRADGSFTYRATDGFFGTDQFEYVIETTSGPLTGIASIKVLPADATPVP